MTLLADEYLAALQRTSRSDAVEVVARARASGAGVWDVAHQVIGRAQQEIGERWERNTCSVADEHAASVLSHIALSAIAGAGPGAQPAHGTIVGACVDGEWHAFPLRLVAEGLREAGWEVVDLGASLPAQQLAGFLSGHRPDVVMLSASMPGRLPAARRAAAAAASVGLPAVLGGGAVSHHPEWATLVGAVAGVGEMRRLHGQLLELRGAPPVAAAPAPGRFHAVIEVEDQLVARLREGVARSLRLETRDDWESILDAHLPELVAALAAAALVDDAVLLGDQVRWLDDLLVARNAPVDVIDRALLAMHLAVDDLAPSASGLVAKVR